MTLLNLLVAFLIFSLVLQAETKANSHSDISDASETETLTEPLISSRDLTAILGGVICFWGGVWALGAIFMVVLMAKNYCIQSAAAGADTE